MNLVFEEGDFPMWLTPGAPISEEQLLHLRDANPSLSIEREPNGELYIKLIDSPPQR
jgi:hypothetical protein